MGTVPNILVVDDEDQIRKFLRISLEAHGYTVHEARLGADGLELCAKLTPDLVILDLGLPDMEGTAFIARLREWSQALILVLSVRESEAEKVEALDAGANDYVTKPFGIRELMARIRALLRSHEGTHSRPPVFQSDGLKIDFAQRTVHVDDEEVHLSKKEYQLLRLLVANRDQVLTHQHILREVWGPSNTEDTHYLRVLVGQLRQKLGENPAKPRFILEVHP